MTIKFKSNLRGVLRAQERIGAAAVRAIAKDAVRIARRRISVDTGASRSSVGDEMTSATHARVGAGERPGLFLETRDDLERYRWLGPALKIAESRAQAVGGQAAAQEARRQVRRIALGR